MTKLIKKNRGDAHACKLVGWNGLLGTKESSEDHIRMGREIADYAIKAGVKGLIHSDELPAYGISAEEKRKIRGPKIRYCSREEKKRTQNVKYENNGAPTERRSVWRSRTYRTQLPALCSRPVARSTLTETV